MATPEEIAEEVFENTPEVEEEAREEVEEEAGEEESGEEVGEEEEAGEESEEEVGEGEEAGEESEEEEGGVEEEPQVQDLGKKAAVDTINHVLEKINDGLVNINRLFELKKSEKSGVNGSISNMLNYQMEKEQDKEYLQYVEYLKAYYERAGRKSEKSGLQKGFQDGKILLTQKGQQIRITPSVIVDLYHYKDLLEREIHTLLFKIVDLVEHYSMTQPTQKEEFEKYKSAYITFKKQYDDIQKMEEEYITKMKSSELEIANIEIQLGEMKEARISTYAKIKSRISQRLKDSLVMKFKESNLQKPPMEIISAIAKEEGVAIDDIELWLEWIEKSYLYVSRQEEYSQLLQKHTFMMNQYEHMMKNYILQKPIIEYQ